MGRLRKVCTRSSMSPHSRETWLLEMPSIPMARTRSSTERVEMPWTWASWTTAVSAFGQPARFEKDREVAAASQLGDAQFDRTRTGLPVTLAVAIALVAPLRTALLATATVARLKPRRSRRSLTGCAGLVYSARFARQRSRRVPIGCANARYPVLRCADLHESAEIIVLV